MSWAKFDDQYPDHPKIVEVGPLGMALHTAMTCYCARYLTDGFVPKAMMSRLICFDGISLNSNAVTNKSITDELIRVGLIESINGGFHVHDYEKYNPPAIQVKAEREANAARQAKWREEHRGISGEFDSNAITNTLYNTAPSPSPSPSLINQHYKGKKNPQKPNPAPISVISSQTGDQFYARVWSKVTGMPAIPGGDLPKVLTALDALHSVHRDERELIAYLKKYYDDWLKRKTKDGRPYSKANCAWLFDLAVAGETTKNEIEEAREKVSQEKLNVQVQARNEKSPSSISLAEYLKTKERTNENKNDCPR